MSCEATRDFEGVYLLPPSHLPVFVVSVLDVKTYQNTSQCGIMKTYSSSRMLLKFLSEISIVK